MRPSSARRLLLGGLAGTTTGESGSEDGLISILIADGVVTSP